jgi:uncharacterized membrane protein YqjE
MPYRKGKDLQAVIIFLMRHIRICTLFKKQVVVRPNHLQLLHADLTEEKAKIYTVELSAIITCIFHSFILIVVFLAAPVFFCL